MATTAKHLDSRSQISRYGWIILFPRAHDPSGLWQGSRALATQRSNDWAGARFTHFRSLSRFITQISTVNLRHSSLSVLSPIILPLQKFFSRVLLLRQQAFSSRNLPPERPTTTTTAIKTQVFMFRYELVNSTRKFIIVVEIVSLLKKICKRDAPFRAVFKVKTLAVLFPPYPREMKTNTAKFNLPPFCRLLFCLEMQTHSHARSIARAWLKHAHSFDRCEALAFSNTGSLRFTDFPSNLANLIG